MIDAEILRGRGMTSQRTRDRMIARLREDGVRDERVLEVMSKLPRHIFVDEALASRAYEPTALPIGHGQTISQPYVVARMTELLIEHRLPESVLEIGTGSGYQAAVLGALGVRVFTVERIRALAEQARTRFSALKLWNVRVRHGDGSEGWSEHAPYDAVIVTAAPEQLPETLVEQLVADARLVAPVGPAGKQQLMLYQRGADGISRRKVEPVSFVPLLGGKQ